VVTLVTVVTGQMGEGTPSGMILIINQAVPRF